MTLRELEEPKEILTHVFTKPCDLLKQAYEEVLVPSFPDMDPYDDILYDFDRSKPEAEFVMFATTLNGKPLAASATHVFDYNGYFFFLPDFTASLKEGRPYKTLDRLIAARFNYVNQRAQQHGYAGVDFQMCHLVDPHTISPQEAQQLRCPPHKVVQMWRKKGYKQVDFDYIAPENDVPYLLFIKPWSGYFKQRTMLTRDEMHAMIYGSLYFYANEGEHPRSLEEWHTMHDQLKRVTRIR